MNNININSLLVLFAFIFLVFLVYGMFNNEEVIIEQKPENEGYESMPNQPNFAITGTCNGSDCVRNPTLRSPRALPEAVVTDLMPNGGMGFSFRETNARYDCQKCQCGCPDRCSCGKGCNRCNCGSTFDVYMDSNIKANKNGVRSCPVNDGIDWRVNQEPGANHTKDDNIWHFVEPRMVLKDGCLDCNKWKNGSDYCPPGGMLNGLAAQHDFDKSTQNQISGIVYDDFSIPNFEGQHTLSKPIDAGIVPVKCDCAAKMAAANSCGATGCPV